MNMEKSTKSEVKLAGLAAHNSLSRPLYIVAFATQYGLYIK